MRTLRLGGTWSAREQGVLRSLRDPGAIQDFLDGVVYSDEPIYRCPRRVLQDRKAHCVDGALFAAAALWRLGLPPLIAELTAVRDDDHVLALFQSGGRWGAVAKSNFVGLRFREPIYRSLRELAMSYFEAYYNVQGDKTLRRYSVVLDLSRIPNARWLESDAEMDALVARLEASRHYDLLSRKQASQLRKVDARSYESGLIGANAAGLYQPVPARA